jgi:peptide/nickel transport system substrate-binding protein
MKRYTHPPAIIPLFIALLIALLALTACTAPAAPTQNEEAAAQPVDSAGTPVDGGVVTRALTTEPSGLDPHGPPGSGQNVILPYIFDTLIYLDGDNVLHPFLAESWEISEDGKTITFSLRPDVTFHDGTPMNADAVVFTFERFMELGGKSPVAGGLRNITSVEAVDENTVAFHFEEPSATFFSTIALPYAGIISPTAVEQAGEEFARQPVGTGPFMLDSWEPGVSITLKSNPDYNWGPADVENKGAPYIDAAAFKVIPDASAQLAAFQAGEVDIIFVNQPAHLEKLKQEEEVQLQEMVFNSLVYLGFNTSRAPFDDVNVRRALAHAIDKDALVEIAVGGVGQPACQFMASTLPGYDPALCADAPAYDPEEAKALLAEAGFTQNDQSQWERDGEILQATILTSTRPPNGDVATMIQAQLAAIGVPIDIQQLDARAVLKTATAGDYDIILWRYGWNDPDVLNIYLGSDRIGRTNRSFYSNPAVDEIFAQTARELDPDARAQLYVEAQKLLMQDMPWIPLYEPVNVIAISGRVQDTVIGPMGRVLLNDARVIEN